MHASRHRRGRGFTGKKECGTLLRRKAASPGAQNWDRQERGKDP